MEAGSRRNGTQSKNDLGNIWLKFLVVRFLVSYQLLRAKVKHRTSFDQVFYLNFGHGSKFRSNVSVSEYCYSNDLIKRKSNKPLLLQILRKEN